MKKHKWIVELEFRGEKYKFLTSAATGTEACIIARDTFQDCVIFGWVLSNE